MNGYLIFSIIYAKIAVVLGIATILLWVVSIAEKIVIKDHKNETKKHNGSSKEW